MSALPNELKHLSEFLHEERRTGHGHVVTHDKGRLARCGGPAICQRCKLAKSVLDAVIRYHQMEIPSELRLSIPTEPTP